VFQLIISVGAVCRAAAMMWWLCTGLTDEELEDERLREMERLMQREAQDVEEQERVAAEAALLKARRQEEWVCYTALLG